MGFRTESDDQAPRDRKIRRILIQLLALQLVWVALLAGLTFGFHFVWTRTVWPPWRDPHKRIGPFTSDQLGVAAQVVPSTVIAIFVFAVGVAFVVAQVVPQARGTRAVEQLRDTWRLNLVISPAPPLVVGSAVLVAAGDSSELAGALLALSVVYVIVALPLLISILIDATDPAEFKSMLFNQGRRRTESTASLIHQIRDSRNQTLATTMHIDIAPPTCPLHPTQTPKFRVLKRWRRKRIQRCTDRTYELVRTLRGWVRVSATTGDSRELFEALEGTLDLASNYSRKVMSVAHLSGSVPTNYWSHAHTTIERSPMFNATIDDRFTSRALDRTTAPSPNDKFRAGTMPWAPELLIRCSPDDRRESNNGKSGARYEHLPATWFANETGRTIVRAVEFSLAGNGLLDRDVTRLLNTLQNAIMIFAGSGASTNNSSEKDSPARYWSAGVGIHYLVEVGLGVKRCTAEQIEWFHDPFLRLVWLHHHFRRIAGSPQPDALTSEQLYALAVGACAGALRVGEAIIWARSRVLGGSLGDELENLHSVVRAGLPDNPWLKLWNDEVHNAVWLASDESGPLASTDQREIRHCDRLIVEKLLERCSDRPTRNQDSHQIHRTDRRDSRYPASEPHVGTGNKGSDDVHR